MADLKNETLEQFVNVANRTIKDGGISVVLSLQRLAKRDPLGLIVRFYAVEKHSHIYDKVKSVVSLGSLAESEERANELFEGLSTMICGMFFGALPMVINESADFDDDSLKCSIDDFFSCLTTEAPNLSPTLTAKLDVTKADQKDRAEKEIELFLRQVVKIMKTRNVKASSSSTSSGGTQSATLPSNLVRPIIFINVITLSSSILEEPRHASKVAMLKRCSEYTQADYTCFPIVGEDFRALVYIIASPFALLNYLLICDLNDMDVKKAGNDLIAAFTNFSMSNHAVFDAVTEQPGVLNAAKLRVSEIRALLPHAIDWAQLCIKKNTEVPSSPDDVAYLYGIGLALTTLSQPLRDLFFAKKQQDPIPPEDQDKIDARKTQICTYDVKVRVRAALNLPLIGKPAPVATKKVPPVVGRSGDGGASRTKRGREDDEMN